MLSINYVSSDGTRWGAGLERVLTAAEIDRNFWEVAQGVLGALESPLAPRQIASFTQVNGALIITMDDGSTFGPIAFPVVAFRWRGEWTPVVSYLELDIVSVAGDGIYLAMQEHTSALTFDPLAVGLDTNPLYRKIFATPRAVIMDRVIEGTEHTVVIAEGSFETVVVWSSEDSGDKLTHLPSALLTIDGYKITVATTLSNGDTHTIDSVDSAIHGNPDFSFDDDPRGTVTLVADRERGDWIIT